MRGFLANAELAPNCIEEAKRRRLAAGAPLIDLTATDPIKAGYLFPPECLLSAASEYIAGRRYDPDPRGHLAARETVASYYSRRGLNTSAEQVFLTASTSEAYNLLFNLLSDPGDSILAPEPSYPLFDLFAEISRVNLRAYRLSYENHWAVDEESLCCACSEDAAAMLVVSPHNPTGMIFGKRFPFVAGSGLPIIADEVFSGMLFKEAELTPLGVYYPELPVFHLNGISKLFGLPDFKLSWIVLNDPAMERYAQRLDILNDTFLGASMLIQRSLPRIFDEGMHFSASMREGIKVATEEAVNLFRASPRSLVYVPDAGPYLVVRIEGAEEEAFALRLLASGVLVHPGYFYGIEDGCHIVISCMAEHKDLMEGVNRVIALLND